MSALEQVLLQARSMRYSVSSLAALSLVVALFVGCSTSSSLSPASPSAGGGNTTLTADQIFGSWTLVSLQTAGQTEQSVPGGASYALALADGRASVRADCNTCGGTLVVGSQTLTIGPLLACTRAACPTMAFETTYVAILAGESAARFDGNALTLTSSRGLLRFRR